MKRSIVTAVIFLLIAGISALFYINSLTFKIQKAVHGKDCTVSAAVMKDNITWIFNNKKAPLMSVFKIFIAVKTLKKLEFENDGLNKIFIIQEADVDKNTYTPMLKKYKTFPIKITARELLEYLITQSDNNACDILLNYAGGAKELDKFLCDEGFCNIEISVNEAQMWTDFRNEYKNRAYPADVIKFIRFTIESNMLSDEHKNFLYSTMLKTATGRDKLKAGLPEGVIFGHKTGSSSRKPDGTKIADNDAGFVILPDGSVYYIAVFITESKMTDTENAALISQISKIAYEYFNAKRRIIK